MRGLSEYRIRAADSISPPLALEGAAGSVFWMLAPWNLWGGWLGGARALWILDSGNWAVGGSTGVGARPRTLDSGFWKLGCRRVEGCGPARAFWILDSGSWGFDMGFESGGAARILHSAFCILRVCVRRARGLLDSGFWKLETGLSEGRGVWARPRILYSGFWKLGCRRGDGGVGRPDSAFCILYSAGDICMFCICMGAGMSHEWMLDSGFWKLGCRRDEEMGRPDSVFCILYSAGRIYAWAATTRVPGVCVCVIQQPLYHLCGRE